MRTADYDIDAVLAEMANQLRQLLDQRGITQPSMVGIHTGGVWIAQRLKALLGLAEPLGALSISFYRDDFSQIGLHPEVKPSDLPFDVDDRHIILVDDVLQSGRTIRAALNELFDFGRPASVILATLVDRSGRELPFQADVVGIRMELGSTEQIKLAGPDELALVILTPDDRL